MKSRIALLIMIFVFCAGILTFIHFQQQILNQEIEGIKRSSPKIEPVDDVVPILRSKAARGQLPVIDPKNDPLAPMSLATKPAPTSNVKSSLEPEKFYELPMDSPIIAQ